MENTSLNPPLLASTNVYSNIKEIQLSDCFYILHTLMQSNSSVSMHICKALILVNKELDFPRFINVSSINASFLNRICMWNLWNQKRKQKQKNRKKHQRKEEEDQEKANRLKNLKLFRCSLVIPASTKQ